MIRHVFKFAATTPDSPVVAAVLSGSISRQVDYRPSCALTMTNQPGVAIEIWMPHTVTDTYSYKADESHACAACFIHWLVIHWLVTVSVIHAFKRLDCYIRQRL